MASENLSGIDVLINPIIDNDKFISTTHKGSKRQVQQLDFDLSVTVSANEAGKIGASIKVLGLFDFGAKSDLSAHNITTSRLKFSIPISFQTNTKGVTPEEEKVNLEALTRSLY